MMNQLYPAVGTGVSIEAALSKLNADFYYGDTTIDYVSHIKAIMIKSAGMYVPESYSSNPENFFVTSPKIPAIFFHGERDSVFLINKEHKSFSPDDGGIHTPYNSESYCLIGGTFKAEGDGTTPDVIVYGLRGIRNSIFSVLGIYTEVYIDCQARHTQDSDGVNFKSDFGTGDTTKQDVIVYMIGRGCTFFQAKLAGILPSLGKSLFIECKNNRKKCKTADNYDNTCCLDCDASDSTKCSKNQYP